MDIGSLKKDLIYKKLFDKLNLKILPIEVNVIKFFSSSAINESII